MINSSCVCRKKSAFKEYIVYKNENVFRQFEGTIIGKCRYCGLLKTFPPKTKTLFNPKQSRGEYYDISEEKFIEIFKPIIEMVKTHVGKGSVLDVGCSSGILLQQLKQNGFAVTGIEPNIDAFKKAQDKLGTVVFNGVLQDFQKKNRQTFDCIIYNHVLEHVEDPLKEINLIHKSLKKRGLLVVGVPNTNNIIFFLRQKYWESLMPNEHVWHFSAHYLARYLKKSGFREVERSFNDDPRADYPLKKRMYFRTLSVINRLFNTSEAVVLGLIKD